MENQVLDEKIAAHQDTLRQHDAKAKQLTEQAKSINAALTKTLNDRLLVVGGLESLIRLKRTLEENDTETSESEVPAETSTPEDE